MVAVPSGQQAAHSVSGAGGGNFGAFHLPTVSVRSATDIDLMKWKMSFQNVISFYKLQSIVQEGKPPERDAVIKNWPELQGDAITAKFNECLSEYQRENILLYFIVFPSLDFTGKWMENDMETVNAEFVHGDLRDGNGLLKWFLSFHDINSPEKQKALRVRLSKFKIPLDITTEQLLKTLLDYLATWEKLIGNDRRNPLILNDYYVKILDLWPTQPYENPVVRARAFVSEQYERNMKLLDDPAKAINQFIKVAKSYGVPLGGGGKPPHSNTLLALEGRLTMADNDCSLCDVFGCKAKGNVKLCVVYNPAIKIGENTQFCRPVQMRFITGARAHLQANPELKTMKNVKFSIDKSSGPGKGGRGGGRGGNGGRGAAAGRTATPVMAHFFGDDDDKANPESFEDWLEKMQCENVADGASAESDGTSVLPTGALAAPVFANFFGGGDPPEAELTDAIRDEIARASAVATSAMVESAVAATPMNAQQTVPQTPNLALTPVQPARGQVTPVQQRSSLQALRESQSGGGITATSSAARDESASGADTAAAPAGSEELSLTDRLFEVGAAALQQQRELRKAKKTIISLKKWAFVSWLEALFKFLGFDKLNKYQRVLLGFIMFAAFKPNSLPMRVLREKVLKQLVIARDVFISNVVGRLIGFTSTGLLISMGSQRTGNGDGGSGNGDDGPASGTMTATMVNESIARAEDTHSRSNTPSSRSVTPLSPIPESSAEAAVDASVPSDSSADLNIDSTSSGASDIVSQRQSGVKPAVSDAVSSLDGQFGVNNSVNEGNGSGNGTMDNSSLGAGKTALTLVGSALMLGRKAYDNCSKTGNKIRTGLDHSGNCALTNNLISNVPFDALLFDNGATCSCAKTPMGRLLGSYEQNPDSGGISIGEENSTLESDGSYLHALEFEDAVGSTVQILLRMENTPKAICSIFSEPEEVHKRGGKFLFTREGRIWTLANGKEMRLHMTANHLGWVKFRPISDGAQVRRLLSQTKNVLIVDVHRAMAAAEGPPIEEIDNLSEACERTVRESVAEIDAITASLNMQVFIDPVLEKIDYEMPLLAPDVLAVLSKVNPTMCPTVVTYTSDTTHDPDESHWLTRQGRDTLQERRFIEQFVQLPTDAVLVASTKGKDLFVQVNRSTKLPKGKVDWVVKEFAEKLEAELDKCTPDDAITKLAKLAAKSFMALQRVCTSYAQWWDEPAACNAEGRLAYVTKALNKRTNGKAKHMIDAEYKRLKSQYTDAQWHDLVKQREAWLKKCNRNRPRDAINFAHKTGVCTEPGCADHHEDFTFLDVLTNGLDSETSKAILSLAKAPPSTIGMARPVKLTGLEILWRMHCVLDTVVLNRFLRRWPRPRT